MIMLPSASARFTAPLPNGSELVERIRILAAQGLKLRDISSLLSVHPMIVQRVLTHHTSEVS